MNSNLSLTGPLTQPDESKSFCYPDLKLACCPSRSSSRDLLRSSEFSPLCFLGLCTMDLLFCDFISVSLFFTPEPRDPGEPIGRRSLGVFPAICVGSVSGAAAASEAVSPPRTCSNSCFVFDFVIILSFKFHFGLVQEPEANRSFQDILCHLRALVVSRTPHRYLRFKHKLVLFWKC